MNMGYDAEIAYLHICADANAPKTVKKDADGRVR
jgi:hypothetical protein